MSEDTEKDYLIPFLRTTTRNGATRVNYAYVIGALCDWLEMDFIDMGYDEACAYSNMLRMRVLNGEIGEATAQGRIAVCNRFGEFIKAQQDIGDGDKKDKYDNPFSRTERFTTSNITNSYRLPDIETLDKILSAASDKEDMFFIITLSLRCCLSLSQILALTKGSFKEDGGKDNRRLNILIPTHNPLDPYRIIPLSDDVAKIAKDYLSGVTHDDGMGHIFLTSKLYDGKPHVISERWIQMRFKELIKKAGIEREITLQDIKNKGLILLIQGAGEEKAMEYTDLTADNIGRYSAVAHSLSDTPTSDLVCIRIVQPFSSEV